MSREVVTSVILSDSSRVWHIANIEEVWISPILPNGNPNPLFRPEDRYKPRLFVRGVRYTHNDDPISEAQYKALIERDMGVV